MLKPTDPDNFRRSLAGLCLITAPPLQAASQLTRITIEDGAASEGELLARVAANTGLWNALTIADMASVVLFVPAVLGLVHLLRSTAPVLSHLGGALALVGLLGAAGHNVFGFVLNSAMAGLSGERAAMVLLTEQIEKNPTFLVVLVMFVLGYVLGFILLAVGVFRARVAPRWAAIAVLVGMLAYSNAGSSLPLTAVAAALLIVGLGTIGVTVLRMSDTAWRRPSSAVVENTRPEPAAAV